MLQSPEGPTLGLGGVRGLVMVSLKRKYTRFFYLVRPQADKNYSFQTQGTVLLILESLCLLTKKAKNLRPHEPKSENGTWEFAV